MQCLVLVFSRVGGLGRCVCVCVWGGGVAGSVSKRGHGRPVPLAPGET